jgi:hypothetical protein
MTAPGVKRYRVLRACVWAADGLTVTSFTPGTLLDANDPRVNAAFLEYGLSVDWIEELQATPAPTRTANVTAIPHVRAPEPERELDREPTTRKRRRA